MLVHLERACVPCSVICFHYVLSFFVSFSLVYIGDTLYTQQDTDCNFIQGCCLYSEVTIIPQETVGGSSPDSPVMHTQSVGT